MSIHDELLTASTNVISRIRNRWLSLLDESTRKELEAVKANFHRGAYGIMTKKALFLTCKRMIPNLGVGLTTFKEWLNEHE